MANYTMLDERYSVIRFRKYKGADGNTFVSAGVYDPDIEEFCLVNFTDRRLLKFLFADCSSKDNATFVMIINDLKGGEHNA